MILILIIVLINGNVESSSGNGTGGICGKLEEGKIENCKNESYIETTTSIVGGIVGDAKGDIFNCKNIGDVSSKGNPDNQIITQGTGGIVGRIESYAMQQCSNKGNINSEGLFIGGIAGYINNGVTISQSYNYNASVICKINCAGGICGRSDGGAISDCYNYLSTEEYYIKANGSLCGGIIGNIAPNTSSITSISNCYCIAKDSSMYSSNNNLGIFVGNNYRKDTIINNGYYLNTSSLNVLGSNSVNPNVYNVLAKNLNDFKSPVTNTSSVAYLLNGNKTSGLWNQNNSINDGYPYLVNNTP